MTQIDYNEIARIHGVNESRRLWQLNNADKLNKATICDSLICPCCNEHYFGLANNYETCPVCKWQDDGTQRNEPDFRGGANKLSLNEYQKEWLRHKVSAEMKNHAAVV